MTHLVDRILISNVRGTLDRKALSLNRKDGVCRKLPLHPARVPASPINDIGPLNAGYRTTFHASFPIQSP
jgi:hypothetical protein